MTVVAARAPLRVSLGGGGTDLPSHYRARGGFVVSAAIDRYVYMLASRAVGPRYVLKHLEWEEADRPEQIRHPILRAALRRHWQDGGPLEIASLADVPPGTGSARPAPTRSARSRRSGCWAARTPERASSPRTPGGGDRPARPHRRQAGPLRGRARRRPRLHVPPGRHRRGAATRALARDVARAARRDAALLHGAEPAPPPSCSRNR